MSETVHESTAAWHELLETLAGLDRSFLDGDRAVTDDRHIADGYRMIATTLGVAFDTYLFAEPDRPVFVAVNTPFRRDRRWGGDNTDAYYYMCPVDPNRRYRISGNRGDSVYFSLTAYNEPSPGAWSDRIVAIVRDEDLEIDAAGRTVARDRQAAMAHLGPVRNIRHGAPYSGCGPFWANRTGSSNRFIFIPPANPGE